MNSGRKLSGFLACLIMLIQIQLSKFLCFVRVIGLSFGLAFQKSHNPCNCRQCGGERAISAHDVSSVDGSVLGTHLAVIYTTFPFPEVGVESFQREKLSVCPGLSYVRAKSGSFILFSTENKLLSLPAKKGLQYIMQYILGMNEELTFQ